MHDIVEAYENHRGRNLSAARHPSSGQPSNQTSDLISSIHQSLDLHCMGWRENEWLGEDVDIKIGRLIISLSV